jgi:DNA-binding LacI/PurR family transcriptional regulator
MRVAVDRFDGYTEALEAAGRRPDPALIAHGDHTEASGGRAMQELLERRPELDAVFVASDLMAVGALTVLHRAGRQIPDDVAVVGFDDAASAAHTLPPLTTVHQPIEEQGRVLARLLTDALEDPALERSVVLPTHLVIRESA